MTGTIMFSHLKQGSNHLSKKMKNTLKELTTEECLNTYAGDRNTQRLFRYLGSVVGGIVAGQPHAAYGIYAGMR